MKDRQGCVYLLRNLSNGKGYIGQHKGVEQIERNRWGGHIRTALNKRDEKPLYRAIRKYGVDKFSAEVVWRGPIEKLNEKEMHYIKKFSTFIDDGAGYNLTRGGGQGTKVARQSKIKMRDAQISRYSNSAERQKVSLRYSGAGNPFYGKKHTAESRAAMSAHQPSVKGAHNPFYGKHHTSQTIELIRWQRTGSKDSQAAREAKCAGQRRRYKKLSERLKLSDAQFKRWDDVSYRQKMSKLHKLRCAKPEVRLAMREAQLRRFV